jgi:DNA-directed RNA polymerase subunit K/omega
MVKPTIAELSCGNRYNRYMLVMMAAKGAKYVIDKENYEKDHPEIRGQMGYDTDDMQIDYDKKPVTNAIRLFNEGKIQIKLPPEAEKAVAISLAEIQAQEQE